MGLQKHRSEVRKKSKIKKILEDQPLKKGGPIRKNKGGPIDARKIAKKYFKGTF